MSSNSDGCLVVFIHGFHFSIAVIASISSEQLKPTVSFCDSISEVVSLLNCFSSVYSDVKKQIKITSKAHFKCLANDSRSQGTQKINVTIMFSISLRKRISLWFGNFMVTLYKTQIFVFRGKVQRFRHLYDYF